ncbi:MAG: cation-translocating P-type ATPase [Candidatus Fimivivens sp.]|nr:cation-translocating P-type ATPase [Candidatus Fimivivens sp.]
MGHGREEMAGLTTKEAQQRLLENGENRLDTGKKHSALKIFAGQFRDLMVIILLVATAISAVLGELHEAVAIVVIVLINALLGFFQELRCEQTLEALAKLSAPLARVRRDGRELEISAAKVVQGDLLLLSAGDCVAADAVVLTQNALACDEALLTGESEACVKRAVTGNESNARAAHDAMVFMGTHVVAGHAQAQVSATGMATEMGAIAGMLSDIEEEQTPLQKRLDQVGRVIGAGCLVICMMVAAAGVWRGEAPLNMLITGISLAVAAVPEGLPAIVTISLALAVRRILRRNALIKHLHAVETLGCATVICSDKTGTLTQNRMTVQKLVTITGECAPNQAKQLPLRHPELRYLLETAAYCNDARAQPKKRGFWGREDPDSLMFSGDPTETALLKTALDAGVRPADFFRRGELAFDSTRKRMTVWGGCADGVNRIYMKGAPELVLSRCARVATAQGSIPLTPELRRKIIGDNARLAGDALRVMGFAFREQGQNGESPENNLVFAGLIGLFDPPRPEAAAAVAACRTAQIRAVMITGDHAATAKAVARQLGILRGEGDVITGEMLDAMTDGQLLECCKTATVFARVSPAHKLRIVRAMKENGEIVAMTGDGVNDAPAVKESSIGVAMGASGTDVTREAADVILLDDNFATLVAAVEEGRTIYQNIRRFLRYLLSCNAGEVFTMFVGMLMGMPVILTPIQLLLVNLVTDGLPAIALGLEPSDPQVMRQPPRRSDDSIFSDGLLGKILFRGVLIGLTTLGVFSLISGSGADLKTARTAALCTLTMTQLFHVFECRSETKGLLQINPFTNPLLLAAALASMACVFGAVYHPAVSSVFLTTALTFEQMKTVLLCSLIVPAISSVMLLFSKKRPRRSNRDGVFDNKKSLSPQRKALNEQYTG